MTQESGCTMTYQFKHILIYSIQEKSKRVISEFIPWLQKKDLNVSIYADTAKILDLQTVPVVDKTSFSQFDLMIVIGGDGSMLSAARLVVNHDIPILGINTGKLGFLVDHNPTDFDEIDQALKGDYFSEKRALLSVENGTNKDFAMNEVMISRQEVGKVMSLTLHINNECVCQYLADGLIIATPTGSTAHAMSAGGSIIHPDSNALLVIPVCPNKLNSRPIVIPDSEKIEIVIDEGQKITPNMSNDGKDAVILDQAAHLKIEANHKKIKLIHKKNYSFYQTIKQKLHWEKILNA